MGRALGSLNKITRAENDVFDLAFKKLGGWKGLVKWAKNGHLGEFYTLYVKRQPKHIKTEDTNKTHEQFIQMIKNEQEQRQLEKGKPVMVLDAPVKEAGKS